MLYQLDQRQTTLTCLCVIWQAAVRGVPGERQMDGPWGPEEADLRNAAEYRVVGSWDEATAHVEILPATPDESDGDDDFEQGVDDDGDLLEALENVAFSDAYRADEDINMETLFDGPHYQTFAPNEGCSPSKRVRFS
jgi:hypothetical protein